MSAALCLLLSVLAAPEAPTKEDLLWAQLRERLAAVERGLPGVLGAWVKDLSSGRTLELHPDEVFPTASSIKIAVLYELFRQAEEGHQDLDALTRPPLPRVGGGGVLQELGDHVSLSRRDLAVLMMAFSDNEATNLLIDAVGRDAVNRRLSSLGFSATRLRRKMMDLEAARRGDENVSTPAELGRLMETLYRGTGLSPAGAQELMRIARVGKWGSGPGLPSPFRAGLPDGVPVADKSGELEGVRCVVAVVDLPGRPYVAALMTTYLRRDADGEAAIRELSAAIYDVAERLARATPYGRRIPSP